ncbi:hypothetical protein BJV74DRAFT_734516, partial [Russula compacta]
LVMKQDKEDQQVGKQNFIYTPNMTKFAQIVQMESPKAYSTISEILPLPTKQPRFPISITSRTFDLAESHLQALDYHGPVGLACDDTKLLPSFWPYYDSDQQCYVLLGHAGDVLLLP